jgi:L-malate glycosyltransferase
VRRRLRIGYIIGALDAAGSERQLLALAERLPADEFAPEFIVLSRPGVNAPRAVANGIPVHLVPPPVRRSETPAPIVAWRLAGKAMNYLRLVRRRRYDIIDAWLFHAYVLAAATKPVAGAPVLVSGRRSLYPREASGRSGRLLQRLSVAASDAIVANSPQVRDAVVQREGADPAMVRVIRNGVEIPRPASAADRARARAELGMPGDALVIGTVANLLPGKGHDELLEAAARVVTAVPAARFVLVGDGLLRPALESRAARLGISGQVVFAGSVPQATDVLPAFDILAHPSLAEGMPNAILEAAAAGLPIAATRAGGTLEIVRDGETGLLVPPGDAEALAAAIVRLSAEPRLRGELGAAARQLATATFGMDRFAGEFAELYRELGRRRGIGA